MERLSQAKRIPFFVIFLTLSSLSQAQTFTVLHAFSGPDGAHPSAVPIFDRAGNLYGPTESGTGNAYNGSVYKLGHHGEGWVLSSLYDFQGGSDGAEPAARLTFRQDGTLFGSTLYGGSDGCVPNGCGTVFQLRPPASFCRSISCPWTETQAYVFPSGGYGAQPNSPIVFDQAGNAYGTAGGDGGLGVAYELSPTTEGWTETILHGFRLSDGSYPNGVISDSLGNLYGTTYDGGPGSCGTVFELSPSASGWTFSVLYSFDCRDPEGGYLLGRLVLDNAGNLYGTTLFGGDDGSGTVFELSPQNGSWTHSILYSFPGEDNYPGTLVFDNAGNLYGINDAEGGSGYVFKLTNSGGNWTYATLYYFTGGSDGAYPVDTVVLDNSGNVYGVAEEGGSRNCQDGCGTVWEITP